MTDEEQRAYDYALRKIDESRWEGQRITKFDLSDIGLSALPAEVGKFRALLRLHLDRNNLVILPPEIGELSDLRTLSISANQLCTLPAEMGRLSELRELDLSSNKLTELPPEIDQLGALVELDLSGNQLTALPPEIGQLTELTRLFLHGNPALAIPESILGPTREQVSGRDRKLAARPHDILNFYFAQKQGAAAGTLRPVNEIKVMLVGRGGAGKTSLRRFFMGEPHDKGERETPGIALDSFRLSCRKGKMLVRLWDFAGQEITHALHQFFLTEGCVYILVLDPRSNTEMQDAEYWLGLLKRYANGAPALIALNRQDSRKGGYNVDRWALLERFPFIRGFTPTNCDKREGCVELRHKLSEAIDSMKDTEPPHLMVPKTWLAVMKACYGEARSRPRAPERSLLLLLKMAGHGVPSVGKQYLKLKEFRQICSKNGETEPAKQESLARLLHQLGAVLHFVDEPRLRDTAVLNPHWVTDGVYRLLRYKDGPGSDGTMTLAEALIALPTEKEKEARFLLRLMERFEMCFPINEGENGVLATKWLIPGALDDFQPMAITAAWKRPGCVRLRYVFDPLPEGVLPRFIVMTHMLSEGKPRWRHGVVLEDGRAAALVRRGEKRNHVEVTAFGPDAERLRLLEFIQGTLDRINVDLPDPKPISEIELAGLPGVFRSVADLEAAELGNQQFAVDTWHGKALVEPTPQLNLTSEPAARGEMRIPLSAFLSYSHEDKREKSIFQQNLTVMAKKKFITPWHDGLIEPGMRWREEVEQSFATMDIFVGLLTKGFINSDFIEKVEIRAARQKLREQGKEFLFILILVENISLDGLNLEEYVLIRPGGKAVSKHSSRKEGFNVAQNELEEFIIKRQASKGAQCREETDARPRHSMEQEKNGITIIVQGDYFELDKSMKDDHSIHIGGNVTNAQVGQTLTNCTNTIQQQQPGERKDLLEQLQKKVEQLIEAVPSEKQEEVAGNLELAVKAVTGAKPNRAWYSVSAEGLMEASKFVKDFSGNIAGTIGSLGKLLWPDFRLPESK